MRGRRSALDMIAKCLPGVQYGGDVGDAKICLPKSPTRVSGKSVSKSVQEACLAVQFHGSVTLTILATASYRSVF